MKSENTRDDKLKCPHCPRKFGRKRALEAHMTDKHPIQMANKLADKETKKPFPKKKESDSSTDDSNDEIRKYVPVKSGRKDPEQDDDILQEECKRDLAAFFSVEEGTAQVCETVAGTVMHPPVSSPRTVITLPRPSSAASGEVNKSHQSPQKVFKCRQCIESFSTLSPLARHVRKSHDESRPKTSGKIKETKKGSSHSWDNVQCPYCNKGFASIYGLDLHAPKCPKLNDTENQAQDLNISGDDEGLKCLDLDKSIRPVAEKPAKKPKMKQLKVKLFRIPVAGSKSTKDGSIKSVKPKICASDSLIVSKSAEKEVISPQKTPTKVIKKLQRKVIPEKSHPEIAQIATQQRGQTKVNKKLAPRKSQTEITKSQTPQRIETPQKIETEVVQKFQLKKKKVGPHSPYRCTDCGKIYKYAWNLKRHHKEKHSNEEQLSSQPLKKAFDPAKKSNTTHDVKPKQKTRRLDDLKLKLSLLKKNKKKSLKSGRYLQRQSCKYCQKSYFNARSLEAHVNEEHKHIAPYSCLACAQEFYTEYDLMLHKRRMQHFQNRVRLTKERMDNSVENVKRRLFPQRCDQSGCTFSTRYIAVLNKHRWRTHAMSPLKGRDTSTVKRSKKMTPRDHCFFVASAAKKEKAAKLEELESTAVEGEDGFACQLCPKIFKHKSSLRDHLTVHTGLYRYKCSLCPRGYNRKYLLEVHMTKAHQSQTKEVASLKSPRAKVSSSIHKTKSVKQSTQSTSSAEKMRCGFCRQTFADTAELSQHIKKCSTAENSSGYFALNEENLVQLEELANTAVKDENGYVCFKCSKTFKLRNRLKRHLSMHTGLYRFTCPLCGKGSNSTKSVIEHMDGHQNQPQGGTVLEKPEAKDVAVLKSPKGKNVAVLKSSKFKDSGKCSEDVSIPKSPKAKMVAASKSPPTKEVAVLKSPKGKEVPVKNPRTRDVSTLKSPKPKDVLAWKSPRSEEVAVLKSPKTKRVASLKSPKAKEVSLLRSPEAKEVTGSEGGGENNFEVIGESSSMIYPTNRKGNKNLIEKSPTGFYCAVCSQKFTSEKKLEKHIRYHKEYISGLESPRATELATFNSHEAREADLKSPKWKVSTVDGQDSINSRLRCNTCEDDFESPEALRDHMEFHKPALFTCKVCAEAFKHPLSLREHVKCHEPEPQVYECNLCGETFKIREFLQIHAQEHMSE